MGKLEPSDFYLYRWRYYIGYGFAALIFAGFLLFVGQYAPGALSQGEMKSVVESTSIGIKDPSTLAITDMPYHLLQKASIEAFGVTTFGVKLPSLVIGFITCIGAVLLLRRWFRPSVALLATLIMVTTIDFLYISQSGTPNIMYIALPVWLLLAGAQVINHNGKYRVLWCSIFYIVAGLSLYSPLSAYLLIAIISTAFLHPHVRFVLKQISWTTLAVYGTLLVIMLAPLAYFIYLRPALLLELLGKPDVWPPDILANISLLFNRYVNFIHPSTSALLTPVLDPGRLILIGLGVWQLARTYYNARSYTIATWLIMLVPVLIISPQYSAVLFVPFLIFIASGINFLVRSWYGLFPHNPYARVLGLIPLVVLVGGLVLSSMDRYSYSYHYGPGVVDSFNRDYKLLNAKLRHTKEPVTIVVSTSELPFYRVLAEHAAENNKTSIVISDNAQQFANKTKTVIASRAAKAAFTGHEPSQIITTPLINDADRFYIFSNVQTSGAAQR